MNESRSSVDGDAPLNAITVERTYDVRDDELSLLDLLIVLAKYKLSIVLIIVAAAIGSALYALQLPNIYTATARVLPPQQSQPIAAAMLGQLGGLAGIAGGSLGLKNPIELYVGMLKSRTVADHIIERFALQALYRADTMAATRSALAANTRIATGRDGLIVVDFHDKDAKLAAAVANAYVEELEKLTQGLAVTEAAQRRLFFQRQLERTKDELIRAEIAARSAMEKGGVAMVDEQGRSIIEAISRVRAQITTKEVQISAMQGFANEQNPELMRARQELQALHQQLRKLEGAGTGSTSSASSRSANEGLKNLGLLRDVRYNEILFELIAKQYELAKIEESKDAALIQVVDHAVVPDRKSKPNRTSIVLVAVLAAAVAGVLLALLREMRERADRDPVKSARLTALRRYLSLRPK
jgi:tyrosine-protein kinase Etk/Wzc